MTYVKQMQRIVDEYRLEALTWPTSAKNIADWAISTGRWELPAAAIRRRCADDIASAILRRTCYCHNTLQRTEDVCRK